MKGTITLLSVIGLIISLALIAFFGQNLVGIANVGEIVDGCTAVEGTQVIPVMGYYECKPMGINSGKQAITIKGAGWITCGIDEYTPACEVKIDCPVGSTWFIFNQPTRLAYKIGATGQMQYVDVNCAQGSILLSKTLQRKQYMYVEYQVKGGIFWLGDWEYKPDAEIKAVKTYTPYGLWLESRTGRSDWINKQGCFVNSNFNLCLEGSICDKKWDRISELDFGEATNFLESWAYAPIEYNIVNHPQYGKVYCAGNAIYSLGDLKLSSGCYKYPQTKIANVECCPGQITGNAVCGNDFKWKTQITQNCISDIQCPGQGSYLPDYSDTTRKTVIKYSCINGQCISTKKVTGCSTNEACPTNQICYLDYSTGIGTCKTQQEVQNLPLRQDLEQTISVIPIFSLLKTLFLTWLTATIIVIVLIYILKYVFKLPIPYVSNIRNLLLVSALIGLILAIVFNAPIANISASIWR